MMLLQLLLLLMMMMAECILRVNTSSPVEFVTVVQPDIT